LRADEIFAGDADSPAKPRGHADDLVGGVNRAGTQDFRDRRHLLDGRKHLDADHGGFSRSRLFRSATMAAKSKASGGVCCCIA
jgi:hypothetical protein